MGIVDSSNLKQHIYQLLDIYSHIYKNTVENKAFGRSTVDELNHIRLNVQKMLATYAASQVFNEFNQILLETVN